MPATLTWLVVPLSAFLPLAIIGFLLHRNHRDREARSKSPFEHLRRRPAGESLRIKLAEINERILDLLGLVVLIPVLVCITTWQTRSSGLLSAMIVILISWVPLAFIGRKLYLQVKKARNYRLGFDGERYVAEELSRLIAHQYEIFHDVPFDGFNVDHVLVGLQGVFAIETKTRRKPRSAGTTEGTVKFDGSCLRWPWGADTYGLQQAASNGRTISQWLSGATGQSVFVQPILTLPGWWVDRTVPRSHVWVLNPKEIIAACKDAPPQLTTAAMRAIVYQLERHCKIVQD